MWPFSARSRTSSKPIPALPPVTRITFDMAELFIDRGKMNLGRGLVEIYRDWPGFYTAFEFIC